VPAQTVLIFLQEFFFLNKEITVHKYQIGASKFENSTKPCLTLQIEFNNAKRVVFTSGYALMEQIELIPKDKFPFTTTIIDNNDRYEFS